MQLSVVLAAAACASSQGASQAGAGSSAGEPPVVIYGVTGRNGLHPVVRVPFQTAYDMGVVEPTFATTEMIERLEAECSNGYRSALCRRELAPCREKTCRIVPVY